MLDYNDIKPKKFIVFEGEPYEVMEAHVFRKQQRKPVNATKLKNLITGGIREHSFAVSDKVNEAEIEEREVTYLYNNKNEYWFCEVNDKAKRFKLEPGKVADKIIYVKPNSTLRLMTFGEPADEAGGRFVGLKIPIKIELKVKEAAPAVRGNTVQGGVKQVTLETGLVINTPMFVNLGDTVVVNTETGDYVERK